MILEATKAYNLRDGGAVLFPAAPDSTIRVQSYADIYDDVFRAFVRVFDSSGTQIGGDIYVYTEAELTAFTPGGSGAVVQYCDLVEQAVKASLEATTENTSNGATFNIH